MMRGWTGKPWESSVGRCRHGGRTGNRVGRAPLGGSRTEAKRGHRDGWETVGNDSARGTGKRGK